MSSHPYQEIVREAENYGIRGFFRFIRGGRKDIEEKAEGLIHACDSFGIPPGKALYVGDTTHDINAAMLTGLRSASVLTGYHTPELLSAENPDLPLLENLSGLEIYIR